MKLFDAALLEFYNADFTLDVGANINRFLKKNKVNGYVTKTSHSQDGIVYINVYGGNKDLIDKFEMSNITDPFSKTLTILGYN